MHLDWKDQWISGKEDINKQHKKLIEIADHLLYISLANTDKDKIIQTLETLRLHIVQHFQEEELMLRSIGYPEYEKHVKAHRMLLEKTQQLKEAYQKGEIKPSAFFGYVIDDVVVGHMQNMDEKFFPYLKNIENKKKTK